MSTEQKKRLVALAGWSWEVISDQWEDGFRHLEEFVLAGGHARAISSYVATDGYKLGQWIIVQRSNKEKMQQDRRERLESLVGWGWIALVDKWEEVFGCLIQFVKTEKHARVPKSYVTIEGVGLGRWIAHQRAQRCDADGASRTFGSPARVELGSFY